MTAGRPTGTGPSPAAPPPAPASALDPVVALAQALDEERRLLDVLAAVRLRIRGIVVTLRQAGLSWHGITARVVRAQGRTLPVGERLKMADSLRKRSSTTRRPHFIVEEWPSAR